MRCSTRAPVQPVPVRRNTPPCNLGFDDTNIFLLATAVLLPELGMEEPYFKGLSSASPSVPIFNEDPGSTSLSVTALAFDDAKSNDYNYPKLENPLRELLETEREYVLRIRTIYNVSRFPFSFNFPKSQSPKATAAHI